ncbi:UrcA family protein [Parasphingorhabdus marina DSM 22363]|uniref:UrcA family protein n=1 Tax=Parasphingorhabdus marina DSM 22363 TaxID=1123272 RepID=A0A1N6CTJ6_9SPHN|nr:UrcA family protein [Parasphingorhabdus marina]SIN61833.1 UrcA family protein [Parasphingorhabdus marina DSM 22363]
MLKAVFTKGLVAAAAVAVTATGLSATANAQEKIVRTAIVHYDDLDLASAAGQQTLEGRLKGAVRKVCGSYQRGQLAEILDHQNCMAEAKASATRAKVTIMAAAASGEPVETAMVISR